MGRAGHSRAMAATQWRDRAEAACPRFEHGADPGPGPSGTSQIAA